MKSTGIPFLPSIPFMLVAKSDDEIANQHDNHIGDESRQSHLGLSDALVLPGGAGGDPITKATVGQQTDHGADEDGKVCEADALGREVVGRGGKVLGLGQIDGQEGAGGPRDDKGAELDDGEGEQLPWDPEVQQDALDRVRVALPQFELLFGRRALVEVWVSFGGGGFGEFG